MRAQRIGGVADPAEVVRRLGAVQAQDFAGVKWALGVRGGAPAEVERALDDGAVLRMHAMRGTWQLVAAEDARWLVELVADAVLAKLVRRETELGIDAAKRRRAFAAIERALDAGAHRTREELREAIERAGVRFEGPGLSHVLGHAELERRITSGAQRRAQTTWAAFDARAPNARRLHREEALAVLARRYFESRGPATLSDFTWWSGLTIGDARAACASLRGAIEQTKDAMWRARDVPAPPERAPAHLLPAFDELLIGYRNRDAVLDPRHAARVNPNGGLLAPCVLVGGRVVGTWRRDLARGAVRIAVTPFARLERGARAAIAEAAERYARFVDRALELSWT